MKDDTMSSNKKETKVEAGERSETSISRRDVIKATAGSAAIVAVTAVVTGQEQTTTYELGGATRGWQGEAPQSISGDQNPTLTLEPGAKYEITWENLDGQPHNVVIIDGNSNQLVRSEIISEGSQTVEFTASDEMSVYFCEVHPTSMRGSIEIGTSSSGNATNGSENTSNDSENMSDGSDVQVSKPNANVSDPKGNGSWQPYDEDSEEAADKYVDNSTILTRSGNGTEGETGMEDVETATETSDSTDSENETESGDDTTSESSDDGTQVSSGGNGKAKSGNGKAKAGNGKAKSGTGSRA